MLASSVTRRESPCAKPGTVSGHILEAQLLRAYRAYLHRVTQEEMNALVEAALGPAKAVKHGNCRNQAEEREERIEEKVPELVQMLQTHELQEIAPLLLEQHDMVAFARAVLAADAGNTLRRRELEPVLDSTYLLKAAGMGSLSRHAYTSRNSFKPAQSTGGPPLVLTPPVAKPMLRTHKRRRRGLHPLTPPNQLCFQWPPVAAGRAMEGGL